jgi:hypothetical protein
VRRCERDTSDPGEIALNLRVPSKVENALTSRVTIVFSRETMFRGVSCNF